MTTNSTASTPAYDEHDAPATAADGVRLAMRRLVPRKPRFATPVVLTHGTFSNTKLCEKLAQSLATAGFESWLLDWRGHGSSDREPQPSTYEQLALRDVGAAVDHVLRHSATDRLFWIGHSAGGVLPFIDLAHHPEHRQRFAGVVAIASQTTHAGHRLGAKFALTVGFGLTKLLGRAPGKLLRLGPEDESLALMTQWFRWNLSGRWLGADGFDYAAELAHVDVPMLAIAGDGDRFIAPMAGCQTLFAAIGSVDKHLITCGRQTGYALDFGHGQLIAGRHASAEIWPHIEAFLTTRAQPRAREAAAPGANDG